ncbi:hypothetical protein [Terrarubrum flagellatum]|uniref:hypothetical protein n=1 Tax=Terrirubrum flagellatum TaxID=2895980 RepID=UPI0031455C6E
MSALTLPNPEEKDRILSFDEIRGWMASRGIYDGDGKPVSDRNLKNWMGSGKLKAGWEPARRRRFCTLRMLEAWWIEKQDAPVKPKSVPRSSRAQRRPRRQKRPAGPEAGIRGSNRRSARGSE